MDRASKWHPPDYKPTKQCECGCYHAIDHPHFGGDRMMDTAQLMHDGGLLGERALRIEHERDELRTRLAKSEAENDQWQKKLADTWAENQRLRTAFENSEAACLIQVQMVRAENDLLRIAEQRRREELVTAMARLVESEAENDQWQKKLADTWAEVARLRIALVKIAHGQTPMISIAREALEQPRQGDTRDQQADDERHLTDDDQHNRQDQHQ